MDVILFLIKELKKMVLFIYTRKGCCICDKLKNDLNNININNFNPKLEILEVDIDRFDLYKNDFKKYDHQVPVLALQLTESKEIIELPRVSPRLKGLQLDNWLKKNINHILVKASK